MKVFASKGAQNFILEYLNSDSISQGRDRLFLSVEVKGRRLGQAKLPKCKISCYFITKSNWLQNYHLIDIIIHIILNYTVCY